MLLVTVDIVQVGDLIDVIDPLSAVSISPHKTCNVENSQTMVQDILSKPSDLAVVDNILGQVCKAISA